MTKRTMRSTVCIQFVIFTVVFSADVRVFGQDGVRRRQSTERRVRETVREYGTVESSHTVDILSPIAATVVSVVPEGSSVRKGDLLVKLDSTTLHGQLQQQQIAVEKANSTAEQAKTSFALLESQTSLQVQAVEHRVKLAEMLRRQIDGQVAVELKEIEGQVILATERLKSAEQLIEIRQQEGLADPRTAAQAKLAAIEARESLRSAEQRQEYLNKFEHPYKTASAEATSLEARLALARSKHETVTKLNAAKLILLEAESNLKMQEAALAKLKQQVKDTEIRAPIDGMVLYTRPAGRGASANMRINKGAAVRERQPLLSVIDVDKIHLKVRVHETAIKRLRVGQRAIIRVDAFPDKVFEGEVAKVMSTPEAATSFFASGVKSYAALVSIENPEPGLKVGMTALAEINTSQTTQR